MAYALVGDPGSTEPLEGRVVEIAGRGTAFVHEVPGPPGAPELLLLHGLTATAALNWSPAFDALARSFGVLASDLRGHGRGPRSPMPFTLEDCADDVAALMETLGRRRVIVVGYSLGGLVAQLLWRRHPGLVGGLVLCATAADLGVVPGGPFTLMAMPGYGLAARLMPAMFEQATEFVGTALFGPAPDQRTQRWMTEEMRRSDFPAVVEAACAASLFSSRGWVGEVDVPTAVVVTTRDRVVSPARQAELAQVIPGATAHPVDADHGACISDPELFVPALAEACRSVGARASAA